MPHRRTDVSKDKGDLSPICFARVAWQRGASISARILRFFLGRRPSELRQDSFDAKFGTDTERPEVLVHLSIQSPNYVHGMRYEASSAKPASARSPRSKSNTRNSHSWTSDAARAGR